MINIDCPAGHRLQLPRASTFNGWCATRSAFDVHIGCPDCMRLFHRERGVFVTPRPRITGRIGHDR